MTCKEKILSNDFADVMTDFYDRAVGDVPYTMDSCGQRIDDDLGIIYLERSKLPEFNITEYEYFYIPKCYGLMQENIPTSRDAVFNSYSLEESGILAVQRPPLSLTGKGVLLAFIDTGIRYQDELFRNPDGSTRITAIWDQTIQTGRPPAELQYGSEYSRSMIDMALTSEKPLSVVPSTDEIGHGTAMASVAAGSSIGSGLIFTGAAPEADILVVKLKEAKQYLKDYYLIPDGVPCYASSDIWSALQYVESFAITFSRPVVICFGIGTNMGDHGGTSDVSLLLDRIALRRSRCVVVAGGNEGNAALHYEGLIGENVSGGKDVEIRVGAGEKGFLAELWGNAPYTYTISIRAPGGETTPRIYYQGGRLQKFSFIYERTNIEVGVALVEQNSGAQLIVIRFDAPTPGIWTVKVFGEGPTGISRFHMWLPISAFLNSETYFLEPSPYTTLTVPAYTNHTICVSTYNVENSSFYIDSGRGYSRMGAVTPDIAAPGVDISTALGSRTGSSLAAAITAGGAAQIMQWAVVEKNDPLVASNNIKNYIIRGADRSADLSYPNREWGFGRLNLAGTFRWLAGFK